MRADMYIDMCLGLQVAGSAPVRTPMYMHAYVSAHMSTRMRQAPRCVGVMRMGVLAMGVARGACAGGARGGARAGVARGRMALARAPRASAPHTRAALQARPLHAHHAHAHHAHAHACERAHPHPHQSHAHHTYAHHTYAHHQMRALARVRARESLQRSSRASLEAPHLAMAGDAEHRGASGRTCLAMSLHTCVLSGCRYVFFFN